MRKLIIAVGLLSLALAFPANASITLNKLAKQDWVRVTSPHVDIVTDAKPAVAKKMAQDLEQFRHFISLQIGETLYEGVPPLTILALSKRKNFKSLDLGEDIGGLFYHHIDGSFFIADATGYSTSDTHKSWGNHIVMHEFVHYAAQSKFGRHIYPLWFSEATAEYMATFRLIEKGNVASVGDTGIIRLRSYSLMNRFYTKYQKIDIEDLLKTRSRSKSWRDENSGKTNQDKKRTRSKFYARSVWAYHYLHSSMTLANQTAQYIDWLNEGKSVDSAFKLAYNGISYADMDQAMYKYITGPTHMRWKYPVGEGGIQFPETDIRLVKLDKAEAAKAIAKTVSRLNYKKTDEKHLLLDEALQLNPGDIELLYTKLLLRPAKNENSTQVNLDQILTEHPDNQSLQVLKGANLLKEAYRQFLVGAPNTQETIRSGRKTLRKVLKQDRYNARAYYALANLAENIAENNPTYLKEACIAAESVRLLHGDQPSHIFNELDCRVKLKQPETVTMLLRKYATVAPNKWIDTGYGRFVLEAFNLRAQALAKPVSSEKQKLTYDDGSYYKGSVHNNLPHGQGALAMQSGSVAEGNWVSGKLEGPATFTASNAYKYTGEFSDGTISGKGRIDYPKDQNFKSSEGEFLYAFEHGQHRFEYAKGMIIEGETHMGTSHGEQQVTLPNGSRSTEFFVNNRIRLTREDGSIYVAYLKNSGELKNKGLCYSPKDGTIENCTLSEPPLLASQP